MSRHSDPTRDADLLETLDEATLRLLFPERFETPLRLTFVYESLSGPAATAAQDILRGAQVEHRPDPERPGSPVVERATFELTRIEDAHALFEVLSAERETDQVEILIDDKRVPLVRELWLPLLWNLRD